MPQLSEVNSFYIVMALIGIPVLMGFLMEAGKDLYSIIRKKELSNRCSDHPYCTSTIEEMKHKQVTLREERLPRIETKLDLILQQNKSMADDIEKLFGLWDKDRERRMVGQ